MLIKLVMKKLCIIIKRIKTQERGAAIIIKKSLTMSETLKVLSQCIIY